MIRAIVFDLDDTLYPESAWRLSGFEAVAAQVAERCGLIAASVLDLLLRLDGGTDRSNVMGELIEELNPVSLDTADLVHEFRTHRPRRLEMFPEAVSFLQNCPLPTGIVTDGFWESQMRKVEALGVRKLVGPVVVTDLLAADRSAWKPSPVPFRTVLGALGVSSSDAVYVGDNAAKDFVGPQEIGMDTIHLRLPDRVHPGPPLSDRYRAAKEVDSWSELIHHLESETAR